MIDTLQGSGRRALTAGCKHKGPLLFQVITFVFKSQPARLLTSLGLLADVDQRLYGSKTDIKSRAQVMEEYFPYIEDQLAKGVSLNHITKHILGLFHGMRGGKQFRRVLSEEAYKPDAGIDVLKQALAKVH
jgi:tRNA-dihydrouridine synthase